jgi:hypothetical protein
MDPYVALERDYLLAQGAQGVYVLPYPYEKGHFCLYFDGGRREFAFMRDEPFARAAKEWSSFPLIEPLACDEQTLRILTYARLMRERGAPPGFLFYPRKAPFARLMDDPPGHEAAAITLLSALYPGYPARGQSLAALRGAAFGLLQEVEPKTHRKRTASVRSFSGVPLISPNLKQADKASLEQLNMKR